MARDDGRRYAAGKRRLREVLPKRAMHARTRRRVERRVGDVARQRMAKVEHVALAIAEPTLTKTYDGVLARPERRARVERREIGEPEWSACDGEPIDDHALRTRQL